MCVVCVCVDEICCANFLFLLERLMYGLISIDGDGQINYNEFVAMMMNT